MRLVLNSTTGQSVKRSATCPKSVTISHALGTPQVRSPAATTLIQPASSPADHTLLLTSHNVAQLGQACAMLPQILPQQSDKAPAAHAPADQPVLS
jgi:hypothetical protein